MGDARFQGYMAGWAVTLGCISLGQDLRGKEAYLKYVEATWVDSAYTIPFGIALVVTGIFLLFRKDKTEGQQ